MDLSLDPCGPQGLDMAHLEWPNAGSARGRLPIPGSLCPRWLLGRHRRSWVAVKELRFSCHGIYPWYGDFSSSSL